MIVAIEIKDARSIMRENPDSYPHGPTCTITYMVVAELYNMGIREFDVRYWQSHNLIFVRGELSQLQIDKLSKHLAVASVLQLTTEEDRRFIGKFHRWDKMMDYSNSSWPSNRSLVFHDWIKKNSIV